MSFFLLLSLKLSVIDFNSYSYVFIKRIKFVVRNNFVLYGIFKPLVKNINKGIVVILIGLKG